MFTKFPFTVPFRQNFSDAISVPSSLSMSTAGSISASASGESSPSTPSKSVRAEIKGRVQGVFFRNWIEENARNLGLRGWVRNRRNGSVEALFTGDPNSVQEMVERRCRIGPPDAIVTGISFFPCDEDSGQGFVRKPTV